MEYKQKKEQILSSVQFTNLLSFNLVQNKLQRNFRSIVQALLLCQNKADQSITKAQCVEESLVQEKSRNSHDKKQIKDAVNKLNEKVKALEQIMNKLQDSPNISMPSVSNKGLQSLKDLKTQSVKRSDFSKKSIDQPNPSTSLFEKKLKDAMMQIQGLKERIPNIQMMQGQFETLKRDIALLKGEMLTIGNKSSKSIKRQSIVVPAKQNLLKRNSNTVLPSQNSSNVLNNISNRQLKSAQQDKGQNSSSIESQLYGLHVQVNTLNHCFEEMKNYIEDLRKKDYKYNSSLNQLDVKFKKMQDQIRKDAQNFQKQIKNMNISLQTINHSAKPQPVHKQSSHHNDNKNSDNKNSNSRQSQSPNMALLEQNNNNFKNQLNDKLSKIQASLAGFITESQFNRFKGETRSKMDQIQKNHKKLVQQYQQEIKKIYDMFINKDIDLNRLAQSIGLANQTIKENYQQAQRKNNITNAKIDQLKKHLQNLRQDVEYYQTLNAQNLKKTQQRAEHNTQNGQNTQSNNKSSSSCDPKALDQLKKYFNSKLHDQRAYLIGLIRDLQKKLQSSNGLNQEIANMWDKINQINVFLIKKADGDDIKKNLLYLQKKINKIGAYLSKSDENTDDARVAKTNWFCLSCDKNLLGYKGKIGKHLVWDTMPMKGLTKVESKRGLPSLK